jgi:hypothetical protein
MKGADSGVPSIGGRRVFVEVGAVSHPAVAAQERGASHGEEPQLLIDRRKRASDSAYLRATMWLGHQADVGKAGVRKGDRL